jgi:lysophospholipase L1-like esterase
LEEPASGAAAEHGADVRRKLFAASLGLSIALCVWLVAREPLAYALALAALGALLAAGLAAARRLGGWLVALAVANALLVLPELALRAAGFHCVSGVQFGYPTPSEFWELVPDEQLFWRLPPGDDPPVNALGFLGPDPLEPKPAGSWRLVVLGDSCTQQGFPESLPDHLARMLAANGVPVELVNLSMAGYSSHQGRVLAERVLPSIAPDLVLVWYGWNDHWQAYGASDAHKRGSLRRERVYRRSRLIQGLRCLGLELGLTRAPRPLATLRVPPDDFRANLTAIAAAARAEGAAVVLVTAPTAHRVLGVPEYLVAEGFAPHREAVVARHREYSAIVREVAAASGAELCDFDGSFEQSLDLRAVFQKDGIHLSERGLAAAAELLARFLAQRGLLPGR